MPTHQVQPGQNLRAFFNPAGRANPAPCLRCQPGLAQALLETPSDSVGHAAPPARVVKAMLGSSP